MPSRHLPLAIAVLLLSLLSCSQPGHPHRTSATLPHELDLLRPLHERLGAPQPGDWLLSHDEAGQTFAEWRARSPIMARGKRRSIYIQPIGAFTESERRIVELTSEFMQCYFQRSVHFLPDLPEERIPEAARRVHPSWGDKQILSTYVLHEVLAPSLPADAAALIAFTATDLWPGDNWNFVFGQASLRARVGVWSIHRNGDPTKSKDAFRLCLLRTCKTATHETGHMFSMAHCTAYECNMCGSNNRDESDRHPLPCCPECVAKISHATDSEPLPRFAELAAFCKTHGLHKAGAFYEKSIDVLRH